jgi:hypothetical protein
MVVPMVAVQTKEVGKVGFSEKRSFVVHKMGEIRRVPKKAAARLEDDP